MNSPLPEQILDFAEHGSLRVYRQADTPCLEIASASGQLQLTVQLTAQGPLVSISAAALSVAVAGELRLEAGSLHLAAREQLSLASQGSLDVSSQAVSITAQSGNIELQANDDVRLEGERIRMNC